MPNTILVMAGGAFGAALRYHFGLWSSALWPGHWPAGTMGVNLIGGFAMGILAGAMDRFGLADGWRLLIGVGLLGGFTTFSAFSLDLMTMLENGRVAMSLAYAAASVVGALGTLAIGLSAVRAL